MCHFVNEIYFHVCGLWLDDWSDRARTSNYIPILCNQIVFFVLVTNAIFLKLMQYFELNEIFQKLIEYILQVYE